MAIQESDTIRNAHGDAITSAIGASGLLRIYSGSVPASVATAASGTLLAQLACSVTFAPATSGGVLTVNAITQDSSADNGGTAGYFRITTSGGTAHLQGTVGTSGTDMIVPTTTVVAGQPFQVTSCVFTMGGA